MRSKKVWSCNFGLLKRLDFIGHIGPMVALRLAQMVLSAQRRTIELIIIYKPDTFGTFVLSRSFSRVL